MSKVENKTEGKDEKIEAPGGAEGGNNLKDENVGDDESKETVSRADHLKALADMHKYKREAKELKQAQENEKTEKMKAEAKWKELAEAKELEAKEAVENAERIQNSYITDRKFSALQAECQKLGLRPEALSDLEALDLADLPVETTSTGKINILGASKFASQLKTKKPHWFQDVKSAKINGGGNRIIETDGEVTAAQVYEAEKAALKSGDKTKYYELHKKFQQQRSGANRH